MARLDAFPPAARRTRVLLVNMPFAAVTTPSLALGLLKAGLEREGIACDVLYLNVLFAQMTGWGAYEAVARSSGLLAGEQMFAQELFDGQILRDQEYQAQVLNWAEPQVQQELRHLKAHVPGFLAGCLERVPWDAYDIVGFSSMFEQNTASLSLASRVKQRFPRVAVVLGGPNCEGVMGLSLHRCFPFIDYVFTGEADIAFPEFVRNFGNGDPVDDVPGIIYRRGNASVYTGAPERIPDLDELPLPDFRDYFELLERTGAPCCADRQLLFETARGCWWGQRAKCTFCGLNGESIAFRVKSPDRAVDEIVQLVRMYRPRFVRAVDNMMAPSYYEAFLPRLAAANLGVEFFYEVRPTLSKEQIAALARAHVTNVQAGLESLNTHILKLMRKGTTSLRNIEFLKWCQELGVYVDWNLLFRFPGEQLQDYERTIEIASLITHLKAPTSVGPLRLDRFSENLERAEELGFVNVRPWHLYKYIYPFEQAKLMDLVYCFDYDLRDGPKDQGTFGRLIEDVTRWRQSGSHLVAQRVDGSIVIDDTRPVSLARQTVLKGIQADIYEYCDARRTVKQIQEWLEQGRSKAVEAEKVPRVLGQFIAQRLMVEENGWYLSLAVRR